MIKNIFKYIPVKLLVIHAVSLLFFCVFWGIMVYSSYHAGYSAIEGNSYFWIMLLDMIIFIPVFVICLIAYIIVIRKVDRKYTIRSVLVLIVVPILIFILTAICIPFSPAKGYYDYVKENVDIEEIHNWLVNYQSAKSDYPEYGIVYSENWPECIKTLNPKGVSIKEKDSKRYVRIIYWFGPSAAYGLCVMEEPVSVPPYDPDYSDTRIELSNNAFVWMN